MTNSNKNKQILCHRWASSDGSPFHACLHSYQLPELIFACASHTLPFSTNLHPTKIMALINPELLIKIITEND